MYRAAQSLMAATVMMAFVAGHVMGQAADPAPAGATEKISRKWAFSASAWGYFIPHDRKYVQPSFAADRGRLHLEGRYNYEGPETGSLWAGCKFNAGEKLALEVTPILGGVFGNQAGIAPGYKMSLGYWKVEFYSEGEYVFDLRDRSGNFFFNWSELSLSPVDWFRAGLAGQRTRAYKTELDVQRGFLLGFTLKKIDFTAYIMNAGWTDPTVILAVGVQF